MLFGPLVVMQFQRSLASQKSMQIIDFKASKRVAGGYPSFFFLTGSSAGRGALPVSRKIEMRC
jgi:hypothetical protein